MRSISCPVTPVPSGLMVSPSEVLTRPAEPFDPVLQHQEGTRKRLRVMARVCTERNGYAIAAPQIGWPVRVFLLRLAVAPVPVIFLRGVDLIRWRDEWYAVVLGPTFALLEAKYHEARRVLGLDPDKRVVAKEACLSVPGAVVEVPRASVVVVDFIGIGQDGKVRMLRRVAESMLARIIQHEMDHLDGRLITHYQGKEGSSSGS